MATFGGPMSLTAHQYLGSSSDLQTLGFPIRNGVDGFSMLDQFNIAGSGLGDTRVSKLFDDSKTPGSLMSNIYEVNKLGVQLEGAEPGDIYKEAPMYAGNSSESDTNTKDLIYPVKCLYTRNAYHASEEGRARFGNDRHTQRVREHLRFVGFLVVGLANWQQNTRTAQFITIIPGGRTRTKEITRAQVSASGPDRQPGGVPNEQDSVWCLSVKCKRKNPLKEALASSNAEIHKRLGDDAMELECSVPSGAPDTYWNDVVITTVNRQKPPLWKYSSRGDGLDPQSRFVGNALYIGKVQQTEGTRRENPVMTSLARRAQRGEKGWEHGLNGLRAIELFTGMK